jgi:hypothetical protein
VRTYLLERYSVQGKAATEVPEEKVRRASARQCCRSIYAMMHALLSCGFGMECPVFPHGFAYLAHVFVSYWW